MSDEGETALPGGDAPGAAEACYTYELTERFACKLALAVAGAAALLKSQASFTAP